MIRNALVCLVIGFVAVRPAAADPCSDQLKAYTTAHVDANSIVEYWDGSSLVHVAGSAIEPGDYIVFFQAAHTPTEVQANVPAGTRMDSHLTAGAPAACTGLKSITFTRTPAAPTPLAAPKSLDDAVKRYRTFQPAAGLTYSANSATSATSIATEAVQILGQIVVDRATQRAYTLITSKVEEWMKCSTATTIFPATCKVLQNLRLQDIAMAPDLLRQSLVTDLLAYIRKNAADVTDDNSKMLQQLLESQVIPTLAEPATAQTTHASAAVVHRLVDQGLRTLTASAASATPIDDAICKLPTKDRIVALAGAAIALCKVSTTSATCDVMATAAQIDQTCKSPLPSPLPPDDLSYSQSIAGYEWDALTLTKSTMSGPADTTKRLVAALNGAAEIACMYADTSATDAPFRCSVDTTKHGGHLSATEWVAVVRDLSLAAANRDGAALVNGALETLARTLPAPDSTTSEALRLLATITAYAETYTSGDPNGAAAHQARTQLLESLTTDMTNRTNRGGDTIFSFGGSLRAVGGFRWSHSYAPSSGGNSKRDFAATPVLSLPLGLAVDHLSSSASDAVHFELGILDLGQYVSFNDSGSVTTPDLVAAISPSITIAWLHGTQAPFLLGVTVGYTPNFDFESGDANAKKGAFNVGITLGIDVPLFDFN